MIQKNIDLESRELFLREKLLIIRDWRVAFYALFLVALMARQDCSLISERRVRRFSEHHL